MANNSCELAFSNQTTNHPFEAFVKAVRDQQVSSSRTEEEIDHLMTLIDKSVYSTEAERAYFRAGFTMRPIMGTDIVYRALAQELLSRGVKSGRSLSLAVLNFHVLPLERQLAIIDGVTRRIDTSVETNINEKNMVAVDRSARAINMSVGDYSNFLQRWHSSAAHGFVEAKMAILLNLLLRNGAAPERVAYYGSLWYRTKASAGDRLRRSWTRPVKLRASPLTAKDEERINTYLNSVSIAIGENYLLSIADHLSAAMFRKLVANGYVRSLELKEKFAQAAVFKDELENLQIQKLEKKREAANAFDKFWVWPKNPNSFTNLSLHKRAAHAVNKLESEIEHTNRQLEGLFK